MVHVTDHLARFCPSWCDRHLAGGLHPCRVRPQPRNRQSLRPGRLGHQRVLRLPLSLLVEPTLHLIATSSGLPVAFALTGAKTDERDTCLDMLAFAGLARPGPDRHRRQGQPAGQLRNRADHAGITLLPPHLQQGEAPRPLSATPTTCLPDLSIPHLIWPGTPPIGGQLVRGTDSSMA